MQCWRARAGRARSAAEGEGVEGLLDRGRRAKSTGVRHGEVGWRASARAVAPPTRARLDAGSRSILTGSSASARRGEVVWRARRRCRFATPPSGPGRACAARLHKSKKTADDWRACALVTCSTSFTWSVCVAGRDDKTEPRLGARHGRRGRSAKTGSGKVCSVARSLRGGAAVSRRSRAARPRPSRRPPSRRPGERVGGGSGGLGEVGQGRGIAQRQFASSRAR